ncbi:hypothetical protein GcC1_129025 [Golovinomyces cichoracearum]|uniref:Uncharacterized protein n=1 Tax=Golovinomyces cichoracearum TaxID=62708 RepID=A0A420I4W5_9PEZI|nr:hypothetical protein GcC1_129025 [Golovinomyces cichoracearum]
MPSANMPVSAAQIARRYGQLPPPKNNARGSLTIPFVVTNRRFKAGCGNRLCPCRKAGKICGIYFHLKKELWENMKFVDIDNNNDISLLERIKF